MAIVANYKTIRDEQYKLKIGQDIDWHSTFDLDPEVRIDRRMILQFFFKTGPNASNLKLCFKVNGNALRTVGAFDGKHAGDRHEIIPGSYFAHGTNTIVAEIVDPQDVTGSVSFEDVVLWHKVDN